MKRALAALLLVGIAAHAVVAWQYVRADPFHETLIGDALSYHRQAMRLAEQGLGAEPVFHQPPLFPLLLAATYAAAPQARRGGAAIALQCALSLLALLGLSTLAGRCCGNRAALGAGLCGLGFTPVVFYATKLLPLPLALATQTWGLVASIEARRRATPLAAAVAGLAWGVACIARAEMLIFAPLSLGIVVFSQRRRALLGALWLAGFAAVVAPITAHNASAGDPVLIASAGGENLYIGNQIRGSGGYTALDPRAGDLFSQRELARDIARRDAGRELRPSEVSAYWRARALRAIAARPFGWLRLLGRKLARVAHPGDPTDLYSSSVERSHVLWPLWLMPLGAWSILLLAGVGLVRVRRPARDWWPAAALAAVHLLLLLAFFANARLRVPLYWFLCPFAGAALADLATRWRRPRPRDLALLTALVLTIAIGLAAARPQPRDLLRLASVYSRQQRLDEGLAVLRPLLQGERPDAYAQDQAGWIHQKRGDWEDARRLYAAALAGAGLAPARARQTRTRSGVVLERLGRADEARAAHDEAARDPTANAGTFYERGMFRLRAGDRRGARADLERSTALAPGWPPARDALRSIAATP